MGRWAALILSVVTGCGNQGAPQGRAAEAGAAEAGAADMGPAEAGAADMGPAEAAADAAAQLAIKALATQLKSRLDEQVLATGPATAMSACADEALGMTVLAATQHGAKLGRASLRKRNPNNGGPDWVAAWLQAQGERPAAGVVSTTSFADVDGGRVARVIQPIEVGGLCLNCHGNVAQMVPEVTELLAQRYPDDAATGYALGDLRGAFWAEVPVQP